VIDGKQRLTSLRRFASSGELRLTGLEVLKKFTNSKFDDIKSEPELARFENLPIRTVIVRNWVKDEVLHFVFHRLNTQVTPDWFDDLRTSIRRDLVEAERAEERATAVRAARAAELSAAKEQLTRAERALDPHRPALTAAQADVDEARQRWHAANNEARATKGRQHRAAERESAVAKRDLDAATARQAKVEANAAPASEALAEATEKLRDLQRDIRTDHVFDRWTSPAQQAAPLRTLSAALDDWKRWANGHDLPESRLATTMTALSTATHPGCDLLAARLAPMAPAPKIEPPTVELGV
jgi:hypothetical protein